MRRNKVVSIAALVGATALALAACSAGAPAATPSGSSTTAAAPVATTVFKVAFNQPETHPEYIALKAMGERLKQRTNGAYSIDVFPNETLGAQADTIQSVQSGTIAMSVIGGSLLESLNPDFVVFDLPYVFTSQAQQRAVTNDPAVVSGLYSSLDSKGVHVLGAFYGGVRNVYNKTKPINTPADLAGMKIRVMQSDTNIEMMKLMGGTGTPMGQGDVYTAIQSGVLDGGENNELIYSTLKHDEIAPYYSYTRHLMVPDYLIINPEIFNGMPAADQKIFQEELVKAIDQENTEFGAQVDAAITAAKAAGAKFNEVDTAAFQKAVAPLTESKLTDDVTRKIYAQVQAAAK
ncbi:TRAP transporter substrate-binding protein [Demequina lutea]|uniref:Tripartite ATP-independent transporter DctP family solute receptor n=1 Tax=Demequina lutea TaxID=431489 RepID=A0A7Y9ZC41_9MICO|nr:TRAP transporter substrate-binding protein [Demequina lutea]NYI42664.1 tripartite ATP-independent transporter DctP family solute receptor [Demequina lutea]